MKYSKEYTELLCEGMAASKLAEFKSLVQNYIDLNNRYRDIATRDPSMRVSIGKNIEAVEEEILTKFGNIKSNYVGMSLKIDKANYGYLMNALAAGQFTADEFVKLFSAKYSRDEFVKIFGGNRFAEKSKSAKSRTFNIDKTSHLSMSDVDEFIWHTLMSAKQDYLKQLEMRNVNAKFVDLATSRFDKFLHKSGLNWVSVDPRK